MWSFSGLPSPGRSYFTDFYDSWVHTIYRVEFSFCLLCSRKTRGLVLAQSNTETSFDNLGFTGGRKISEYMDLSEFELVRVKVGNSVKRKISRAFPKEDQKTQRVSCGRLDLVEVPANTEIDSDVLLTTWV